MQSHRSSPGASPTPESSSGAPQNRSARTHPQIKIEPTCLVFPPPHYGRCIQNAISIYNVSKQPCVFKMRSQNPERYVAKPHVAVVAPESAARIFVTLRDMNTLGTKNLPEDTHDRFRISLRLYDPSTVDAALAPKELWNVLQARGGRVDHEQDLVSYFTKRDTPVGGLVTFFPPTYLPVTPGAAKAGSPTARSPGSGPASRTLGSDLDEAAPPSVGPAGKSGSAASAGSKTSARKGGKRGGASDTKAAKMPALWIGMAVAAMVVLSLAVVTGVALRGSGAALTPASPSPLAAAQQLAREKAERMNAARARLAAEAERLSRAAAEVQAAAVREAEARHVPEAAQQQHEEGHQQHHHQPHEDENHQQQHTEEHHEAQHNHHQEHEA